MNNQKVLKLSKLIFFIVLSTPSFYSYAKPIDRYREIESKIEVLKKENSQLRHDIEQLEKSQYQNIRQYHDDVSSDLNTYMTWIGIMAAILAMVVTAVSIAIPLMSNRRFEKKIDDLFKTFKKEQAEFVSQGKNEQNEWKKALEKEYRKKIGDILSKMKAINKNVIEIQEQTRTSERNAWISQILSEANREINESRYDAAIRLCTHVIEKDSSNDNAYNTRGIAYGQKGMYDLAIRDFNAAINISPQKHYYSNRALAKMNQNEFDKAIEDYSAAIKIDNSDDQNIASRGYAYFQNKDYKNAIIDFSEAIKINPNEAAYYLNRGNAKFSLNDFVEAIKDFGMAISLNSKEPLFYYNRGNARSQVNDYAGAIADYDEAIRMNNKTFEFFFNRAIVRNKINDHIGAIKDYDEAIKLNDKDDVLFNERGISKTAIEDFESAINDFNTAISLNPSNYLYYCNRGNAKFKLKNFNDAILDYDAASSINKNDPDIFCNRGNAKAELKDYLGAIKDYDEAIKLNNNVSMYYFNRANVNLRMNNYEGVIDDCGRALKLNENNNLYYIIRGHAEYYLEDYDSAINDYKMGVSKGYSKASAYNMIAQCYLKLHNYQKAMSYVNRAIKISDNKDGVIIDTRGEIYLAQNDLMSALSDFNRAIQLVSDNPELFEHRALCYRRMANLETDESVREEFINYAKSDEDEAERLKNTL